MRYRTGMTSARDDLTIACLESPRSQWHRSNKRAYAVIHGPDLLITSLRRVASWDALTPDERVDVLALVDSWDRGPAAVHFELRPPGGRWHIRVSPTNAEFLALPGFLDGEERQLLPALRGGLANSDRVDLLSAFLKTSGLDTLRNDIEEALRRGARIRVLTGDYLNITDPDALRSLHRMTEEFATLEAAVYRCEGRTSFHAKAYIFSRGEEGAAYVGSSNLSRTALTDGVEWNLRAVTGAQSEELAAIRAGFDRLWRIAMREPLTTAWIERYAARPRPAVAWDPPAAVRTSPEPHEIQREALAALAQARARGARRGLVVLATGLGKTLLAAFDAQQLPARRVLFVAHREEIITQAHKAFAWVFPGGKLGVYSGPKREREADLVFATVQTIARKEHLETWPSDHFDLIVVDEFHHAAASSYRSLIDHFTPRFLLGITATPERGDGAALRDLCDDNLVYRASIVDGIGRRRLVPFVYHGLKDDIDYTDIPWRSGRFDPAALTAALATRSHAEQALAGYRRLAPAQPRRGLWFCASIAHAEFMAEYLRQAGVKAVAVHSGPGGASRSESLERLTGGQIEAITAVDVFNEGVDVPDVNVVVLLRPTESRVVFLQQIGRGLRLPKDSSKPQLVILDFIGNHRSFLAKPQALMFLLGRELSRGAAVRAVARGDLTHPSGCAVHIETEVVELLAELSRQDSGDAVVQEYTQLRELYGRRPTLAELLEVGVLLRPIASRFGSWWDLVATMGDLEPAEIRVLASWGEELVALETVRAGDVAAWEALRAWVALGGVHHEIAETALPSGAAVIVKLWPRVLLARDGKVRWRAPAAAANRSVLEDMIEEIAQARAGDARRAEAAKTDHIGIVRKVSHNSKHPILFIDRPPDLTTGEIDVWVGDERYKFDVATQAINVARTPDGKRNVLGPLLHDLLGPTAGASGTDHRVVLRKERGRWTLSRARQRPVGEAPALPFYAELAVACGIGDMQHSGADETRSIRVESDEPVDPRRHFVVRARGDSMAGGRSPIRDGDLVLCRRLDPPPPLEYVEHRPCLLVGTIGPEMSEAMIKVPVWDGRQWLLRSWSKGEADLDTARWQGLRVVARVVEVVQPLQ